MPRLGPKAHAQMGWAVLAAAKATDTRLIERRLAAFSRAHRAYRAAQKQVEALEAQVGAARVRLAARDTAHGVAIDALARALVGDGAPRVTPFKGLHRAPPSAIKRWSAAARVQAIRDLVAAAERRGRRSAHARQAARDAESAARAVEASVESLCRLQLALDDKRRTRDNIGATWKAALAALKRGARAAADDGVPDLYAALFPKVRARRSRKRTPPASG